MRFLIIILILISVNTYAWPFSKKEEKKTEVCHAALQVNGSEDEPRVYYLYRIPCVKIELVGIISEPENKVIHVEGLKLLGAYEYTNADERMDYLEKNFPNIQPLPFFKSKKNN